MGVGAFHHRGHTRIRDLGRAAIGLGLMLLALHTLLDTLAPAENAPQLGAVLAAATAAPWIDLIIGAVLAWAAHSSVAIVILAMLQPIATELGCFQPNPARFAADFHLIFNVVIAAVFIFALDWLARVLTRLLPERKAVVDTAAPLYLDEDALEAPSAGRSLSVPSRGCSGSCGRDCRGRSGA